MLGKPRVLASPVIEGNGWVDCAHGRFPVPAPPPWPSWPREALRSANAKSRTNLSRPPARPCWRSWRNNLGPWRILSPKKLASASAARDNKTRPNVLRVILGETQAATAHDWETDTITVLETNLDDISSEILGHFVEKALANGALDVFYTPIQMKKSRPASCSACFAPPGRRQVQRDDFIAKPAPLECAGTTRNAENCAANSAPWSPNTAKSR